MHADRVLTAERFQDVFGDWNLAPYLSWGPSRNDSGYAAFGRAPGPGDLVGEAIERQGPLPFLLFTACLWGGLASLELYFLEEVLPWPVE